MPDTAVLTRDDIVEQFRKRIALGIRTRLYKEEFEDLIADFIERLSKAKSKAQILRLCEAEISLLEEGYKQATLASDYLPRYRKAIEWAIDDGRLSTSKKFIHEYVHQQRVTGVQEPRSEHWALTFLKYDREVYEDLDPRQETVNRQQQLRSHQVDPQRYLEVLDQLLHSTHKFQTRHLAIAIAGLTGRRIGELLAHGSFSLTDHPYVLHFEGQPELEPNGFDMVTLVPAEGLLGHIERFRAIPEVATVMGMEGEARTKAINKFEVQVNRECDKFLLAPEVVPLVNEKLHVTVRNLRGLWGAIATWLFCPPQHYLRQGMESSATGPDFRYQLVDQRGRLIHTEGILLSQVPELPELDQGLEPELDQGLDDAVSTHEFTEREGSTMTTTRTATKRTTKTTSRKPATKSATRKTSTRRSKSGSASQKTIAKDQSGTIAVDQEIQPTSKPARRTTTKKSTTTPTELDFEALSKELKDELEAELFQMQDTLRSEWDAQLREFRVSIQEQLQTLQLQPQPQGYESLIQRLETLEAENQQIAQERDALKDQLKGGLGDTEEVKRLQSENQSLAVQLREAQAKLDGFRQLLLGNDSGQPDAKDGRENQATEETIQRTAEAAEVRPGRKPGKAMERAQIIFDALRAWNAQHPLQTLAFSAGLLETVFKVHRKAAKQFCEQFQNEINEHHAEIRVDKILSHNRGKDMEGFKAFVEEFQ